MPLAAPSLGMLLYQSSKQRIPSQSPEDLPRKDPAIGGTAGNPVRNLQKSAEPAFVCPGILGNFNLPICPTNRCTDRCTDRGDEDVVKTTTEIDIFPRILDIIKNFEQRR